MTGQHHYWFNEHTLKQIRMVNPKRVCDVGPGRGTWARFIRQIGKSFVQAIEAWEPYVEQFGLKRWYNQIIIGDVRKVKFDKGDLIIFGDILEHLPLEDVLPLVRRAAKTFRYMIINAPLGKYPQDDLGGNPYERHLCELFPEMFDEFRMIESHIFRSEEDYDSGLFNLFLRGRPD